MEPSDSNPQELSPDPERLLARVGELRAQLGALAPRNEPERRRSRAAADAAQAASERILVLEKLLAASRAREEELTASVVHESGLAADLHAQLAEMAGTIARFGSAEALLDEAQRHADAAERRADMLATELRLQVTLATESRERSSQLETDLRAAATQVAESASEAIRVGRLQADLDAARLEAEEQRRHAVTSALALAEAEAKLETLGMRIDDLQSRLLSLSTRAPAAGPVVDLTTGGVRQPKGPAHGDSSWG